MNKMNISSTANEIMREEFKNIIYMQTYRLYDDKKIKKFKSSNLYFNKIKKKML